MIFQILYLIICFSFDFILSIAFPVDFAQQSLVFIPALGFCAMILIVKKTSLLDALLTSLSCGFIYGLFIPQTLFLYPLLFAIVVLITRIWSSNLNESMLELMIICLVAIALKDYFLYAYMYTTGATTINILFWVRSHLFIAIVGNAIFILLVILFYRHISRLIVLSDQRKQKKEHAGYRN